MRLLSASLSNRGGGGLEQEVLGKTVGSDPEWWFLKMRNGNRVVLLQLNEKAGAKYLRLGVFGLRRQTSICFGQAVRWRD